MTTLNQKIRFIQSKQNIKNNKQSFTFHPSHYSEIEIDIIYNNLKNPNSPSNNPKLKQYLSQNVMIISHTMREWAEYLSNHFIN